MSVDNGRQVDLAALDGFLEHRGDPDLVQVTVSIRSFFSFSLSYTRKRESPFSQSQQKFLQPIRCNSLVRVGRVNHHGVPALVVLEDVGIVVGLAGPFSWPSRSS